VLNESRILHETIDSRGSFNCYYYTSIVSLPIFLISRISRISALNIILLISVGCIAFLAIGIDMHYIQANIACAIARCNSVLVFWLDWFVLSSTLELACMYDIMLELLTFAHFLAKDSCTLLNRALLCRISQRPLFSLPLLLIDPVELDS